MGRNESVVQRIIFDIIQKTKEALMTHYTTEAIRTIALVGHGAAGKTSLAEALLLSLIHI